MPGTAALLLLLIVLPGARAAEPPDLGRQKNWTESDKERFLRYLESGKQPKAEGSVKGLGSRAPTPDSPPDLRRPLYATVGLTTDTVLTVAGSGVVRNESTALGPELLLGGHLFSWVRCYGGVRYHRMRMSKLDDSRAGVDHFQVPVGLELALVPLGTPQTRYILLRGGVAAHHFGSKTARADFKTPLIGLQGSWNAGIGYEWQLAETNWRLHGLAEGYSYLFRRKAARFYGAGLTAGLAYMF